MLDPVAAFGRHVGLLKGPMLQQATLATVSFGGHHSHTFRAAPNALLCALKSRLALST